MTNLLCKLFGHKKHEAPTYNPTTEEEATTWWCSRCWQIGNPQFEGGCGWIQTPDKWWIFSWTTRETIETTYTQRPKLHGLGSDRVKVGVRRI